MIRLEQLDGPLRITLAPGRTIVAGRSAGCDLVIPEPDVSRRHAELEADEEGIRVRDLGSANGTLVNGQPVERARLQPDDVLAFGRTAFRVTHLPTAELTDGLPEGTAVRSLVDLLPTEGRGRETRVFERLLEVAAGLSGHPDLEPVLEAVVELSFEQVDADRVALVLAEGDLALSPAAARARVGHAVTRVPRAIADRAIRDRAPVVTESAMEDARFQSGSVEMERVRSAVCAPLLASEGEVLGVLYADTVTRPIPFDEREAAALMAFAGLAAVAIARVRYAEQARREREARRSFERFFAPSVAKTIAAGGAGNALAGGRREVAVLYSDIRGFTPLAERLSPEESARLLGDYLDVVVDLVFEHGGTLDKFIGDAVLAVWGTPLPDDRAADHALGAARDLVRELAALSRRRQAAGRPPIEIGIGISFGPVFAGSIGTARRLDYTVVGDPVNVAARLCAAAAPGDVLLSEEVVRRLSDPAGLESVGDLELRGRSGRLLVYRDRGAPP